MASQFELCILYFFINTPSWNESMEAKLCLFLLFVGRSWPGTHAGLRDGLIAISEQT